LPVPYDPLAPRTNQSVAAFASSIREQLAAIIAANGVAFNTASRYVFSTSASNPAMRVMTSHAAGYAGIEFGLDAIVDAFIGIDRPLGVLRFNAGPRPFSFLYNGTEVMRLSSTGLGIGAPTPAAKLYVTGGSWNSSVHVTSNSSIGAGLTLESTGVGGHRFSLFSSGSGADIGNGSLGIFDETSSKYRMMLDASGRWVFGAFTTAPGSLYAFDIISASEPGRFRVSAAAGAAVWEIAQGDGATSSKVAQLALRALQSGSAFGWDVGMASSGFVAAGDFVIGKKNGAATFAAFGVDWAGMNVALSLGGAAPSFGNGQAVVFVANRSVAPTANPVGGFLMYAESGAAKVRGSSGTVTTFGPADPHCPACGADFGSEHYNPRYGYVSVCLFCLAADLGDKPYIVRHQATEHAEEVAVRTEAEVTAAREERLESALELLRSCEAPAANPTTEGSVE